MQTNTTPTPGPSVSSMGSDGTTSEGGNKPGTGIGNGSDIGDVTQRPRGGSPRPSGGGSSGAAAGGVVVGLLVVVAAIVVVVVVIVSFYWR